MTLTPAKIEIWRRLRLGDMRRLFQHRYGVTFPDADDGREDLRLLLLPISLGQDPQRRMTNAIDLWAPWMPPNEAETLVASIVTTPLNMRRPPPDLLGKVLNVTNAQREVLRLWTIAPIDMTDEQLAEHRKAKRRNWKRAARLRVGRKTRQEYLACNTISRDRPWLALGISRRTWYRRQRGTGTSVGPINSISLSQTCATPNNKPRVSKRVAEYCSAQTPRKHRNTKQALRRRIAAASRSARTAAPHLGSRRPTPVPLVVVSDANGTCATVTVVSDGWPRNSRLPEERLEVADGGTSALSSDTVEVKPSIKLPLPADDRRSNSRLPSELLDTIDDDLGIPNFLRRY